MGFLIKQSEIEVSRYLEETEEFCLLDNELQGPNDMKILYHDFHKKSEDVFKFTHTIPTDGDGFYNTYFVNCEQGTEVSFELVLTQYNRGPTYLSAGEAPLPMMYMAMAFLYIGALTAWILIYMREAEGRKVLLIHYLMTVLIILKIFSLAFRAIELHYKNITGHPGRWDIVYYIFQFCKGTMLFVIIGLIGTGWTFIKPFLTSREKKIFLFVIPLQILDNIALVVVEETAPGSQGWLTWQDILRIVDIICCLAILVPIIWSIKHLKDASNSDGKAARNLEKLKLFRQFYLLIVSYIYFTRIIVALLDKTLPFRWMWLGEFFTEIATFLFYISTGYQFRPVSANPYFKMPEDIELPTIQDKRESSEDA